MTHRGKGKAVAAQHKGDMAETVQKGMTVKTDQMTVPLEFVVAWSPDFSVIGSSFRLGRTPTQIGRSADIALTVDDPRMSRVHAVFRMDPALGVAVVQDEQSSNGTFYNGLLLTDKAPVEDSDVVRVGDTLLVVQEGRGEAPEDSDELKGSSACMTSLRRSIARVAPTELTVLIQGESGTGKELVAAAVHRLSGRAGRFVALNCSSIPETLAETTLFGHVKGAFSGANQDKKGVFEQANGGTLFLDELGELPLGLQAKLLRVLEDGLVTPVGAERSRRVDVRIVTATNVNLKKAVDDESFRGDLLARLKEWPITLPALRVRRSDIPALLTHFIGRSGRLPYEVEATAMEAIVLYDWPFNVRELRLIGKRLQVELRAGDTLGLHHLPMEVQESLDDLRNTKDGPSQAPSATTREQVVSALQRAKGNCSRAAKLLGVSRKTFYRRLDEFEILPEQYRS